MNTSEVIKKCVIDNLHRVADSEENWNFIRDCVMDLESVAPSFPSTEAVFSDPRVQAAFKRFVKDTIDTFEVALVDERETGNE